MRLLKVFTVLLALSSVIALVLASRTTPRSLTAISAVQPVMNFAYVRVEGVVTAYPIVSEKDKFLSFRVLDASGEIRVSAYRSVVEQLLAQARVPMPGDRVSVEGTLRVRDDEPSLVLNTSEALTIETPPATSVALQTLDAMQLGERVQTAGQVRRIRDVSDSLRVITLRDGNAVTEMALPLTLTPFGEPSPLQVGQWLSVTGAIGEYRDVKQLLPSRTRSMGLLEEPVTDHTRPINALDANLLGQWVGIQGEVSDLLPFKQGMRVEVTDNSGAAITVVLFDSVWQALPFSMTLSIDDPLRVQGELAEYRGQLEVLPEFAVDVKTTDAR